jgi:hypothetical protein
MKSSHPNNIAKFAELLRRKPWIRGSLKTLATQFDRIVAECLAKGLLEAIEGPDGEIVTRLTPAGEKYLREAEAQLHKTVLADNAP